MREGDLLARAPEEGGDEIALVARAFNRMGEQLAERDDALRHVDLLRRQMLADVSHELKTPLTAMRGFIETLQMPEIAGDEERRTRYFATLERETRRLERIVADLLDVARLENGVADFEMRVFATRRLFDQVARRNEPVASEAGVAIDVHVHEAADQVYGDPHRLEQAVDNLVANALRHTPRGGRVRDGCDARRSGGRVHRDRHRAGHRTRAPAARLRPLLQGRPVAGRQPRGQRPRSLHRPRHRRAARRGRAGVQRAGADRVHVAAAVTPRTRRGRAVGQPERPPGARDARPERPHAC